jgi:hypothetical protein
MSRGEKTFLPDFADILPALLPICLAQSPEILSTNSTNRRKSVIVISQ